MEIAGLSGSVLDGNQHSTVASWSLINAGKVRALAVTSAKRSQALPNVPALSELGHPKFNMVEWYGVFAPANLPPAIADRFNVEVNKVLQRQVRSAIIAQGQEPRVESRAAFAAMVRSDNQNSRDIIGKAGIKVD